MTDEKFTFFWKGPVAQWHPSYFTVDDVEYSCAEQYMMAEKARLFEDEETLEMIMDTEDPRTQKKLGRVVQGFDKDIWEEDEENGRPRCWNIVFKGNMAKFGQNEHLLAQLLETDGTTLVEASPVDCIWGVGLRESNPLIQNRENWRGKNWLGEVLTEVRETLKTRNIEKYFENKFPAGTRITISPPCSPDIDFTL